MLLSEVAVEVRDANSSCILEFCLEIINDHGYDNDLSAPKNSWTEECLATLIEPSLESV
jgi:hypothetical protein